MSVVNSLSHFAWFVSLFYVILYILGQLDILLGVSLVFLCNFVNFGAVGHWLGVSLVFLCNFVHFGAVGHFARCFSSFYVILYILGQLDIGSVFLFFYVILYILGQLDILRDLSI